MISKSKFILGHFADNHKKNYLKELYPTVKMFIRLSAMCPNLNLSTNSYTEK